MQEWEERAIEKKKAKEEGEKRISELYKKLVEAGRMGDLTKSVSDSEYQAELLKEFNL